MKCPKCGNINQKDALFCDQCGTRLVQPAIEAAPEQETLVAPATKAVAAPPPAGSACAQCGMVNTPGEMFCSECGAPLDAPVPEALPIEAVEIPVEIEEPAVLTAEPAAVEPVAVTSEPEAPIKPVIDEPATTEATCPKCGEPIAADDAFCSSCGASLAAPAPEPVEAVTQVSVPAEPAPTPVAAPAAAPVCPACGADVTLGAAFCDFCGAAIETTAEAETAVAPAPQPAPVAPALVSPTSGPRLVISSSGAVIALPEGSEVIVGREDPMSGIFPEVDLSPHGGEEGGVSRRHLKITLADGQYAVQDLNSTNYTWLNQNRLQAGMPVVLRDGDDLRAGKVRMQFKAS